MKQVTTILCSLAFLLAGFFLATSEDTELSNVFTHQTISAATVPTHQVSMLPLDLQLDLGKRTQLTDSVANKKDTVYIDRPQVLVINKKRPEVNRPKGVTDVAWMFVNPGELSKLPVNNKKIPDREEKTGECDVGTSKEPTIQLIVGGQTVYSKNENHSTGESQ